MSLQCVKALSTFHHALVGMARIINLLHMVTQILPWTLLIIFCNIVIFCFEEYPDSLKQPKQPCVAWSTTNSKICQRVESTDVVWLKQLPRGLVWTTMMPIRPSTTVFLLGANFHMFSTWKTWFQHIQRIFEKRMALVHQISTRSSSKYPK